VEAVLIALLERVSCGWLLFPSPAHGQLAGVVGVGARERSCIHTSARILTCQECLPNPQGQQPLRAHTCAAPQPAPHPRKAPPSPTAHARLLPVDERAVKHLLGPNRAAGQAWFPLPSPPALLQGLPKVGCTCQPQNPQNTEYKTQNTEHRRGEGSRVLRTPQPQAPHGTHRNEN